MNQIHLLPETGFIRLPEVLKLIPISKSAWWAGIKDGRYPKPVKLGVRTTAWRVNDIQTLISQLNIAVKTPDSAKRGQS